MNKKHKCAYCNRMIDYSNIRCDDCNIIWNEGVKFGEDNMKQ